MPTRVITKRAPPREHRHTHGINEHDSVGTGVQLDELVSGGETTLHKHIVTEDLLAGLVTEVTADLVLTDAPVNFAIPFQGPFKGWADARVEVVISGADSIGAVALGYIHHGKAASLSYSDWNALR